MQKLFNFLQLYLIALGIVSLGNRVLFRERICLYLDVVCLGLLQVSFWSRSKVCDPFQIIVVCLVWFIILVREKDLVSSFTGQHPLFL